MISVLHHSRNHLYGEVTSQKVEQRKRNRYLVTVLSDRIESHLIFAIFLHFSFIEGCKSAFLFQSARAVFSLTVSECILTDTVIRTGGRVVLGLLGAGSQL